MSAMNCLTCPMAAIISSLAAVLPSGIWLGAVPASYAACTYPKAPTVPSATRHAVSFGMRIMENPR